VVVQRVIAAVVVLLSLMRAQPAHAHPMGMSSINRALDFTYAGDGRFRVVYALDFAEGPAYAEIEALDADHDGKVTPEEQRRYLDSRLPPLVDAWVVLVDGTRVPPTVVASHVDTKPGEGGLDTLRIDAEVALAASPRRSTPGQPLTLYVKDDAFRDSPGWREIGAELAPDAGASSDPLLAGTIETTTGDGGAMVLEGRTPRMIDARFTFRPGSHDESLPTGRVPPWGGLFALLVLLWGGLFAWLFRKRAAAQS